MKMKKIILPTFVVPVLLLVSSYATYTHAQSSVVSPSSLTLTPTPTTVKSDFAIDLEEGQNATANDQEAKQNQKDQKDNENVGVNEQGEVENEQEGIDKQDMEQSSDDLNEEGEKLDDQQSNTKNTNGGSQQESNQ